MAKFTVEQLLQQPQIICVYADAGFGKTWDAMQTFQKSVYLPTSMTGMVTFASYVQANPKLKLTIPEIIEVAEFSGEGSERTLCDNEGFIKGLLPAFGNAVRKNPGAIEAIVYDEFSTMLVRMNTYFEKVGYTGDNGKLIRGDKWGALRATTAFIRWFVSESRVLCPCHQVLLCHPNPPKYVNDEDDNPNKGELKTKGGPLAASANMSQLLAQLVDHCIHGVATNPNPISGEPQRLYSTMAHPLWHRKVRGFGVQAQEAIGLDSLLVKLGLRKAATQPT